MIFFMSEKMRNAVNVQKSAEELSDDDIRQMAFYKGIESGYAIYSCSQRNETCRWKLPTHGVCVLKTQMCPNATKEELNSQNNEICRWKLPKPIRCLRAENYRCAWTQPKKS